MAINLYINFEGNCREAVEFYSDVFTGMPFVIGNNITIAVVDKDIDYINAVFDRLKEDGTVGMELQEIFWTKCYGSLTDKFGIAWQFNHDGEVN